jgi:histidinol dehydrogenase
MEIVRYPPKQDWQKIIQRPLQQFEVIRKAVLPILQAVRQEGDKAIRRYTLLYDKVEPDAFQVSNAEIVNSVKEVTDDLKAAIQQAHHNIFKFHKSQVEEVKKISTMDGVECWRKSVPIEKVGLYIPGGTSPLFSTVLMLGIPAKIAGCKEIVMCTPPDGRGKIHPAILYTAHIIGIDRIYKVGGAQAIAAMAYGTATIPAVQKIFGPGNQYVTVAKQLISQEGIAIDMPAGPSEVAIVADHSAEAEFVAADLLSQAEHGKDSQVLLITTEEKLVKDVKKAIQRQLAQLPRSEIVRDALDNSKLILVQNIDEAIELVNNYASEHLILMLENTEAMVEKVINAGSVFIGKYTPESAGDYASGTNHTLPTNGFAVAYSGVSLDSFMKKITFQQISAKGLQKIGPIIETMAQAEKLQAHKMAVRVRLKQIEDHKK